MTDEEYQSLYRRWYDQERSCHNLLRQIQGMPQPDVQEFCMRVVAHLAERLRKEIQKKGKDSFGGSVNSIGVSAISSLYRFGHRRRRWYDENQTLHKSVGLLYTLPSAGLAALGFKLGDTMGLMQIYAHVCHEVDQPPDLKDMTRLCTTSLQAGREEAEEVLVSIVGLELYDSLSKAVLERP